ncbi:MAG: menaquinol-cytochrome c reductase cytochrome c1 subunit precursor [Frankiales bacterium]|nr:menaquinol-cytochrome c reductase cytochrome c1 subunit precursor [Frankiales bacterium]
MTTPFLSPQRRRRFSSYLVLALALVILGGVYSALAPSGYAQESASPDQIARGKDLFTLNCASCHGMDAKGGRSGGVEIPNLTQVGSAAVDFQVGTGRMPLTGIGMQAKRKTPRFSDAEIQALATYVGSLGNGPSEPDQALLDTAKTADVARGGRIFSENCAQCHNVVGQGGALTGGKAAPELRLATDKQIWEALQTSPGNMPSFLLQLDDKEKAQVIAYVTSIRSNFDKGGNPIGRLGPVPEGAVGWIIGVGGLLVFCVWIGSRI